MDPNSPVPPTQPESPSGALPYESVSAISLSADSGAGRPSHTPAATSPLAGASPSTPTSPHTPARRTKRDLRARAAKGLEHTGQTLQTRENPLESDHSLVRKGQTRRPSTQHGSALRTLPYQPYPLPEAPGAPRATALRKAIRATQGNAMPGIAPAPLVHSRDQIPAQAQTNFLAAPGLGGFIPVQHGVYANAPFGAPPVGYAQVYPQGPAYAAPFVQTHPDAAALQPFPANPHVPQTSEEALLLLSQLSPEQREGLAKLYQVLQGTTGQEPSQSDPRSSADPEWYEERTTEDEMTVDDDWTPPASGKGKERERSFSEEPETNAPGPGPASSSSIANEGNAQPFENDAYMEPLPRAEDRECHTPSPTSAHVDTMTSQFAMLLLNKMQESQAQVTQLMADFMAKQHEAQELFRKTVEHEVRAVRSKVDGLQNPLPFHGHRRTGKDMSSTSPMASPQRPADRPRADRQQAPTAPAEMEVVLTLLKASVRKHLKTLLKFSTWEELVRRHPPLTDDEIEGYRVDDSGVTCTVENFRIDFIHDWKRFPFNMEARDIFVQNLLQCIKGGAFQFQKDVIPMITEEHIGDALDRHIEYCCKQYHELYTPPKDADDTDEEQARNAEILKQARASKLEKERKRKALNSRKKTLFDSRWSVILDMGLDRHAVLFDRLLPQNMSGDETDGVRRKHPMQYRIVESRWQSVALKTFFRALDAMYREAWGKPKPGKRATGGNAPRTRVERADARVEVGHVPSGLWRNCYDESWLKTLKPYERRSLKMIDADYVFDLDERVPGDDVDMTGDASEGEVETAI